MGDFSDASILLGEACVSAHTVVFSKADCSLAELG